jgi:hypothetical protein
MSKSVYRIVGIIMSFALALTGFTRVQATPSQPATSGKPVYVYYYLWWSTQHWHDKLGSNYSYSASPLPLPAVTDADGCNAVSNYGGNQLLDVPAALFSQDTPGVIENDIATAKSAGVTGFWLNWVGNGTSTQTLTSVPYTPRLAEAFAASGRVGGFTNWVSYKVASMQPVSYIVNDLNFLYNQFQSNPAWERIDGKPVVTFTGSRKYSDADVQAVSNAVRDRIFLVGDESKSTLTAARLAMFDAITYYWSSQDPYGNPQSFSQIKAMGDMVHAAGKRWYAPLAPGYNSALLNGSGNCVPRRNGDTLRALWNGNSSSNPDGWGLISWNEFAENTHIRPLQKWGNTYLNVLSSLIGSGSVSQPPAPTPVPPTPAPSAGGTFDDKNAAFVYSSTAWQTVTTSKAYGGSYRETTKSGSYATFTFTGQSFSIIYKGGSTYAKFDIYVDGALVGTLNEKLSTTNYQKSWDYPGQLGPGTHTLRLIFKATSTTVNKGSLDAVIVR